MCMLMHAPLTIETPEILALSIHARTVAVRKTPIQGPAACR